MTRPARRLGGERGSALLLILGVLLATLAGAVLLGALAAGVWAHGAQQRAADLAALAAARAMRHAYPRVFAPPAVDGRPNPGHLATAAYLAIGRRLAPATARRNGADDIVVTFPGGGIAPLRVRVEVRDPILAGPARTDLLRVVAEAELLPPGALAGGVPAGSGEYRGPLAYRDGKPVRPDVALAYDRMAAAALRAGHRLVVSSGFRTDAEQARLFARTPTPVGRAARQLTAPPGHRARPRPAVGLRLAGGPTRRRFHFVLRYGWEPWH